MTGTTPPDTDAEQVVEQVDELEAEDATYTVHFSNVPASTFDSGVPGVPIITPSGVQVPAGQLQAVMDAAAANHLSLIVEENP
jgi:hypothetical protein